MWELLLPLHGVIESGPKDLIRLKSLSLYNDILLSNHPRFLTLLDESVKSSLQAETIHFHNYDAEQIRLILEERARVGLAVDVLSNPTFEPIIPAIAAMTVQGTNADARVAIKTLYYAALEPEEDMTELFRRAQRDLVGDILTDLNPRNLLILLAAMRTPDPMVKQVYGGYRRLSIGRGEEPYSYVYFYTNLSYLQSVGLIVLLSTKVGRTYANRIQLLVDPDLIEAVARTVFDL